MNAHDSLLKSRRDYVAHLTPQQVRDGERTPPKQAAPQPGESAGRDCEEPEDRQSDEVERRG